MDFHTFFCLRKTLHEIFKRMKGDENGWCNNKTNFHLIEGFDGRVVLWQCDVVLAQNELVVWWTESKFLSRIFNRCLVSVVSILNKGMKNVYEGGSSKRLMETVGKKSSPEKVSNDSRLADELEHSHGCSPFVPTRVKAKEIKERE